MIYGLLFIIILIYCYEYWKMISKYQHLFFQKENTIEQLSNINQSFSRKINKIKEPFSDTYHSNQFTPYNFTQLSNHAIDVSNYNETEIPDFNQDELIKIKLRNLEGKTLTFINNLTRNYTNLISDTLQKNENDSIEIQKEKIENLILENKDSSLTLIHPNSIKTLFNNTTNTYSLIPPVIIKNRITLLKDKEANIAGKNSLSNFMEVIFTELDKIKKDYQITTMSNLQIVKKYLQIKPIYSKYYPNDLYASKKLNEKHQYLNKPIIREDLPCKWKCQRSWFQCHYSLDN
jgi:hypothetical protein